jgi:membrane-associated phospholipid phosphatase
MIGSTAFDPATLPTPILVAVVLITHLGNPVFVVGVTIGLYWLDSSRLPRFAIDRRHTVALLGILVCSAAVVEVGKTVVDVTRPEAAGTAATILGISPELAGLSTEGLAREANSFPSGHTVAATVLWGGLAVLADGRRSERAIAAGTIAGLVALSRYLLGVHHLTDLAGGLAVGLVLLGVLWLCVARGDGARLALWLAALAGGGSLLLLGAGTETIAIAGLGVGAAVGWQVVDSSLETAAAGIRPVLVALAIVLPLWLLTELVPSSLVTLVAVALATAWALSAPVFLSAVGRTVPDNNG